MSKKRTWLVLVLILLVISLPVYSEGYESVNVFKLVAKFILLLVIFIAMIFVTLYGTKLVAKNAGGMIKSKYIQLLDAINIPGGSKVVITLINNKVYILSIDSNGTNLIDIIDEKEFLIIEDDLDSYPGKDLIKNKISDSKINKNVKLFYENHINKRIKNKEEKNDEKED